MVEIEGREVFFVLFLLALLEPAVVLVRRFFMTLNSFLSYLGRLSDEFDVCRRGLGIDGV